ncbi:GAF domain-containing protein [Aestuariivirga litoralis]|uniref:GAF domain-containing protein n=1 Tax=Aestuariivirga litoralis TaxID=2650924 RepID=UPI0018C51042|nr:GAF domain-containing protein [Aestuariivirga litoralis]MBG1230928.1 GAF domain-containing protein [Aestuariivirga litoralis]
MANDYFEPDNLLKSMLALEAFDILDTPPEEGYDAVVQQAKEICNTPVALVTFVVPERQWFKAAAGFDGCETTLDKSVCKFAMWSDDIFVITDLSKDERTKMNPLVTSDPSIRFYAGAPLRTTDGVPLGSLCVIDLVPRPEGLTDAQKDALRALAGQVMEQLEARKAMREQVELAE